MRTFVLHKWNCAIRKTPAAQSRQIDLDLYPVPKNDVIHRFFKHLSVNLGIVIHSQMICRAVRVKMWICLDCNDFNSQRGPADLPFVASQAAIIRGHSRTAGL